MKLYQLANDPEEYGENAGKWIVVSDDGKDELTSPTSYEDAKRLMTKLEEEASEKNKLNFNVAKKVLGWNNLYFHVTGVFAGKLCGNPPSMTLNLPIPDFTDPTTFIKYVVPKIREMGCTWAYDSETEFFCWLRHGLRSYGEGDFGTAGCKAVLELFKKGEKDED